MFLLALASCRKDVDEITTEETPYVPEILKKWQQQIANVNGSLTGFVTDEVGNPLPDAAVKLGTLTTTTDAYGHFFFKNVQLNAKGTYVQVEKAGFFKGSRRFIAKEDAENRVRIELIAKDFSQAFASADGGTITMNGGATIEFAPNSIRKADGSAYDGVVKVAAKFLDPTDPSTLDRMPGNLQGVNLMSQEVVMATYGMVVAELETEDGQPLNILKGKTATIKTPVPASLQNGAPAEIPLWSFNETYGMWAEEGISKLQNGFYVSEVSHFSFWNCDYPYPLVNFSATFVDNEGTPTPLVNYLVGLTLSNNAWPCYGYTDNNGTVSGLVPQGEVMTLEVFGVCGELLYSAQVGPFTADVDLGQIVILPSSLLGTTLSGVLVDCDGNPIQNGLALIQFDGQTVYEYTTGGSFEVLISHCDTLGPISVTGVDLDELLQSDPVPAASGGTVDVGQISVCDVQLQNYIQITVDGVTAIYTGASVSQDSSQFGVGTVIQYWSNNQNSYFYLDIGGQAVGNYGGNGGNVIYTIYDAVKNWDLGNQSFPNLEITSYGNTGEPIIGNFSGTIINNWQQNPQPVTVSGNFNIIRDF